MLSLCLLPIPLLITFHFSVLQMKTRCLITSGHIINSYMFLMNDFDIIIMADWLLVFISPFSCMSGSFLGLAKCSQGPTKTKMTMVARTLPWTTIRSICRSQPRSCPDNTRLPCAAPIKTHAIIWQADDRLGDEKQGERRGKVTEREKGGGGGVKRETPV